eukprot:TRINITY_DN1038_c0_g1_i4.p1 TRINITY_DN1038_c0_g1~~TRINITY_DN1038_c0_g1_i4.p1  ORF type:complete len:126 (-),score=21.19 TRINITY_DN1038_c0_g1_i4:51-428(-)
MNNSVTDLLDSLIEKDEHMNFTISTSKFRESLRRFIFLEKQLSNLDDSCANKESAESVVTRVKSKWSAERLALYKKLKVDAKRCKNRTTIEGKRGKKGYRTYSAKDLPIVYELSLIHICRCRRAI